MMTLKTRRFVVQEHGSSRHHYDFRLEIGNVLKSWAIPKGPSLNPADKRLAVMVPDHDLEYGYFEGIIPKGSYGAGPVVIWDEGEFNPIETDKPEKALAQGKLVFELKGRKLRGTFMITLMKGMPLSTGKEWLLMKRKDDYAQAPFLIETELTETKLKSLEEKKPSREVS